LINFSDEYDEFSIEHQIANKNNTNVISLTIAQSNLICSEYISKKMIDVIRRQPLEYAKPDAGVFDLIINRNKYRNINLSHDNIIFGINVLSFIAYFIRRVSKKSEEIVILGPVYHKFRELIENNERICLECRLLLNNHDIYSVNFVELEKLMMRSQTKALIICNPHNPSGTSWGEKDLIKISELSKKYNVKVLSDEIHSDLCFKDEFKSYIYYDSEAIIVDSPTKAYNVPALKIAYAISQNTDNIKGLEREITKSGVGSPGLLELNVLKAAYSPQGISWLKEFKEHCVYNLSYLQQILRTNMSKFHMHFPDSSYLAWINVGNSEILDSFLKNIYDDEEILVSDGKIFSKFNETHFRINCSIDKEKFQKSCEILVECYNKLFKNKN
jgi:cysteine-S-conjugate beta-lyase